MRNNKFIEIIDLSSVKDIRVEGLNIKDYPDFSDAYIASATYENRKMTEKELKILNYDTDFIHEQIINELY